MIRRPVLAPGLHPLRHPSGDLLFGITPERRFRVPDSPGVRRTLTILDRGEALPDTAEIRRARRLLAPVLRDGDTLVRPGLAPGEVAAVALRHADGASARLDARQRARVRVEGDLGTDVRPLLEAVGLGAPTARDRAPSAVLVLNRGEPDREQLDELVRVGVPHLLVRAQEAEIAVGPFVLPGLTACLRCCDLHQRVADPAYEALLARLPTATRHDGVADPVPAALAWVALGWAVNDLVRHAEGDLPTTASTVARLRSDGASVVVRSVPAHPSCSCRWSAGEELSGPSATMES